MSAKVQPAQWLAWLPAWVFGQDRYYNPYFTLISVITWLSLPEFANLNCALYFCLLPGFWLCQHTPKLIHGEVPLHSRQPLPVCQSQHWPYITLPTTVLQWIFPPCEDPPQINFWNYNECHSLRLLFILKHFILQSFLHHVRMISCFIQRGDGIQPVTSGKGHSETCCAYSEHPQNFLWNWRRKNKNVIYMVWSLLWTIAVLTVLHSFLHINRWKALFTRKPLPLIAWRSCHHSANYITPLSHHELHLCRSVTVTPKPHTPCATEPGWKGNTWQSKIQWTELKGRYYLYYWIIGDIGKDLWRSFSLFLLLKHGELQQITELWV